MVVMVGLPLTASASGAAPEAEAAHTQAQLNNEYILGLLSHDWSDPAQSMFRSSVPTSERAWVKSARIDVSWSEVEPSTKGTFNWTKLDARVSAVQAAGVTNILFTLGAPVPAWARSGATVMPDYAPPARIQDWKDFCGAVAARYKDSVDFYEVWNEPGWDINSQTYKNGGPLYLSGSVQTDYLPLLQAANTAIKDNDSNSWVISGALLNYCSDPYDFATQTAQYKLLFDDVNRPGLENSTHIYSDQPVIAERPMYFNYAGGWTGGHDVLGATEAEMNWYFAEGTTKTGFDEYLCLQNPGDKNASVTVEYMMMAGSGSNITRTYPVAAHSRFTVNVNNEAGAGKDVAMGVTSNEPVIAERPMYFNYGGTWTGGHDVLGATQIQTDWYFAEGTTQAGFLEYLCLQNPNATATTATVHFMNAGGDSGTLEIPLPAKSRYTVPVYAVQAPGEDVSVWVHAPGGIIAERPMYFDYRPTDLAWTGGHDVVGTDGPAAHWYFAEGTTRANFDEYLCVQNPGDSVANITVTFMTGSGANIPLTFSVNPHSRYTVWVNPVVGPNQDVSMQVDSTQPIIAERPMYFAYRGNITGGHDVMGAKSAGSQNWYFAEGYAGSAFEEYLSIQNPGNTVANVTITSMMKNGDTIESHMQVQPKSRSTCYVNQLLGFSNSCDAVSVHPYTTPTAWGDYCRWVNANLASDGVSKQLVATEIGWPGAYYNPSNPSDPTTAYYNESEQSRLLGGDGLGTLWAAGVRKIWIYEDIDPAWGTSWDYRYYGMFRSNGSAKPAWEQYKYWQSQVAGWNAAQ